ncbi:NAD(P)-dependent oxidoreductase [Streptomyces rugosispiralis]|uniref:NAD(P)H-binding protein n=1 Tax=Streptomyces rugosispiralis TaxID=2967341 RepID=A0ABT1VD52_9ACTN|nr:NAD(P)H-binding protein [Streptomyces rugosispiralis]MCQ8195332.1 NAD(P)H-binding protein [Streptomyces rugosispiralis]
MRIAVLGASGRTGGTLVDQALERGHEVVALVRAPAKVTVPAPRQVEIRQADVTAPRSFPDLTDVDVVVSAIGIGKGDGPGALVAGARRLAAANVRAVWLGALGSGVSSRSGGLIYAGVMRVFVGSELAEKAEADEIALKAGATVFHAPDVTDGPLSPTRRTVPLTDLRRPLLPPRISRTTLAALLLDEAETDKHGNGILVPLG